MKLILWDIDGTLVCTGKAGEKALVRAIETVTGKAASLEGIDYRGRTDAFIAREIFRHHELPFSERALHEFMELYLTNLQAEMPLSDGKTHPGILDILEQVRHRPDLAQGLLTGNLRRGAEIKLDHYQVWRYFEFGAFADDSHIRNELGPFALRRAKDRHARDFAPEDVFIVGDTPHDIACAKAIGAKSIAVATGHFTLAELAKHEPTALLQDLGDPAAFFAVVDGAR